MGALIVGGRRASEVYPAVGSLMFDVPTADRRGVHTCGVTLIERGWAVTAAHCVTDPPTEPTAAANRSWLTPAGTPVRDKRFHLSLGAIDRTAGTPAGVRNIVVHPGWAWGAGPGDVGDWALVRLDRQLELQPMELAGPPARLGAPIRLLGWGLTAPNGSGTPPIHLQELDTRVLAPVSCAAVGITTAELCLDNPWDVAGPCSGDSGGPALVRANGRWQFAGVASRNTGAYCGDGPAVYTSAPAYREWAYRVMRGQLPLVPLAPAQGGPVDSPWAPILTTDHRG
ncbi:Trypsin [Actinosynnema pretiosum]|nr:Trypsin [Actinosynnema pretiosum]